MFTAIFGPFFNSIELNKEGFNISIESKKDWYLRWFWKDDLEIKIKKTQYVFVEINYKNKVLLNACWKMR